MKLGKRISARLKIAAATATVIFTLATVFTSTIAWFSTKTSVEVSGATFTVKKTSGIQYDLYYLDHFVVNESNKDGNFNTIVNLHSGYEVAAANPVFNKVSFDENGNVIDEHDQAVSDDLNPTNISHLWPAHKLTYAIVITEGNFNSFSLESWDEETDADTKTKDNQNNDILISLSWAINLYGAAYNVTKTNNEAADVATGFTSNYYSANLTDKFTYSQALPAPLNKPAIDVVDTVSGVSSDATRQILYFSIEFDDSTSTYYELDDDDGYYTKSVDGNSNCYENLILKDLVFMLS